MRKKRKVGGGGERKVGNDKSKGGTNLLQPLREGGQMKQNDTTRACKDSIIGWKKSAVIMSGGWN